MLNWNKINLRWAYEVKEQKHSDAYHPEASDNNRIGHILFAHPQIILLLRVQMSLEFAILSH